MPDHDYFNTGPRHPVHFDMHFGHQRASGIKHRQPASRRFFVNNARRAVRAENNHGAIGHFIKRFDKHHTFFAQPCHHKSIVHHFMPHINGRAKSIQYLFDDADRAINASAKSARIGKDDLHSVAPSP